MRGAAFPLASVSCLLSGVAALTHQVVWQRLLVLPLGADVYFDDAGRRPERIRLDDVGLPAAAHQVHRPARALSRHRAEALRRSLGAQ